jgi:hypothetical protein
MVVTALIEKLFQKKSKSPPSTGSSFSVDPPPVSAVEHAAVEHAALENRGDLVTETSESSDESQSHRPQTNGRVLTAEEAHQLVVLLAKSLQKVNASITEVDNDLLSAAIEVAEERWTAPKRVQRRGIRDLPQNVRLNLEQIHQTALDQSERDCAEGKFLLTDTQTRVLHWAVRLDPQPVYAYDLFQKLIAEPDSPSEQSVRNALERLERLGLLDRNEIPDRSGEGAPRTLFRVRPQAQGALDAELSRRTRFLERLGVWQPGGWVSPNVPIR